MKYLIHFNVRKNTSELFEVTNENDVLFDYQLPSFFSNNNPILEKPLTDYREWFSKLTYKNLLLQNNPFQSDYPFHYKGYEFSSFIQFVRTVGVGKSFWNFQLSYSTKNNTYFSYFDSGAYYLNFVKSHNKDLKKFGYFIYESELKDTLFNDIKINRIRNIF